MHVYICGTTGKNLKNPRPTQLNQLNCISDQSIYSSNIIHSLPQNLPQAVWPNCHGWRKALSALLWSLPHGIRVPLQDRLKTTGFGTYPSVDFGGLAYWSRPFCYIQPMPNYLKRSNPPHTKIREELKTLSISLIFWHLNSCRYGVKTKPWAMVMSRGVQNGPQL